MVSGSSVQELPSGWKEHVKVTNGRKIKYYTHEERGLKVYSKKQVFCFSETEAPQGILQQVSEQEQRSDTSKGEVNPVVVETNVSQEWLPIGWTMESRTRKNGAGAGTIYKIYTEPTTGFKFYSKPQVIKYVESLRNNPTPEKQKQKQKREVSGDQGPKQDAPQKFEPIEDKSTLSVEDDNNTGQVSLEEVSGDQCSKQDGPQKLESIEDKSTLSGKDDNNLGKISLEIVDRSTVLDDLPPGWVKELRARKSDRKRKDPYYVDPVSGYGFRSKKDARRYLETGDINSCTMKPKPNMKIEDVITAPRNLTLDMMIVDDHGAVPSSATAVLPNSKQPLEAERSKETESHVSADPKLTSVDANADKKLNSDVTGCGDLEHNLGTRIEGFEVSETFNDNEAISSSKRAVSHEQKHPEDCLDTKAQIDLKKSKKRKSLSAPTRFSKRLSRNEPEILPIMISSERALRASGKKSVQKEANESIMEQKAAANGLAHPLDTNQQREEVESRQILETEMQNNIDKPSLGQDVPEQVIQQDVPEQAVQQDVLEQAVQQDVPEQAVQQDVPEQAVQQDVPEQAVQQVQERQEEGNPREQAVQQVQERQEEGSIRSQESDAWYPFGDSLSDPCYEFAFKTLTGEIPFEDTLAFQNLFQQPVETSCTQGGFSTAGLPEIDTTSSFQNEVPYQLDSLQTNTVSMDQLPTNSTIQSTNINISGCSSFGGQQPSLKARSKDYETKVNPNGFPSYI